MTAAEPNPDTVSEIGALAQYSEDSIVSRVLLKTAGGSVTLFAFDRGQELSEHTTPFDALVQIVDGSGLITVGGEEHSLESGQMIRLPSNVPHSVKASDRFKMILTMLR